MCWFFFCFFFFFFNDTATTEIYTLSLHDALPISRRLISLIVVGWYTMTSPWSSPRIDRKSTRLNSSHSQISYAVFCLKKKKKKIKTTKRLKEENDIHTIENQILITHKHSSAQARH